MLQRQYPTLRQKHVPRYEVDDVQFVLATSGAMAGKELARREVKGRHKGASKSHIWATGRTLSVSDMGLEGLELT